MVVRAEQLRRGVRFAADLYGGKARGLLDVHVRRNDFARLRSVVDPYPVYEQIRTAGSFVVTPTGHLASADHAICDEVLRSRRFGVAPESSAPVDQAFDRSFLTRNPPDHTRLRRLAAPAFAPSRLADFRVMVETTVTRLLDDVAAAGTFDLVPSLTSPLPVAVINELLGLPEREGTTLAAYGAVLGDAAPGFRSLRHAQQVMVAADKLTRLLDQIIDERRREPRDDLISALVAAEGDGDAPIRADELVPLCRMLLIAGFETTVGLIGNAVDTLLDHPDQWALLVADPELAGAVVQETLRFDPPVQRTGRVSFDETEVAGRPIAAGQWVNVLIGGANRDPAVFRDPAAFDITRTDAGEHLAFSSGIHHCIGRPLAELEATITLRVLAERMPSLRRAGRVRRGNATLVRMPLSLPVRAH
ncbi:cytochrome P450 [Nocardioides endophyticus]|uniref:Cytochrome P450 n=1 Tax=Nocardioides endophyticus TaxID=1353775 RepID=A0ABP8ZCB8_9ACTN